MAVLGEIRKKQGLILGLLGLALAAFIVMGMNSQIGAGSGQQTSIGTINGQNVDYTEFEKASSALSSNGNVYAQRSSLWNFFVEDAIVTQNAEKMGLGVDVEELAELEFGQNLSPVIQQSFSNPQTRQVDRAQLNQIKTAIEEGTLNAKYKAFWKHLRQRVIKDRLQTKMTSLVEKSMYMPTWMAQSTSGESKNKVTFNYVRLPYSKINDSEINVSDEDLQSYLDSHKTEFVSDEVKRVIKYATFNVIPTTADSILIQEEVAELAKNLKNATNDSTFIDRTSGGEMAQKYMKKTELTTMGDLVYGLEIGEVYGPYLDGKNYKCLKVIDRKIIADSVESRHILFKASDAVSYQAALDSLAFAKTQIETGGSSFADMALRFGTDGTKTKGGDLGYTAQGGMVGPFNDLIFYTAEQGKLYTITTQFGLHLVEVTGKKFLDNQESVRLATIRRAIVPSDNTQNDRMSQVNMILDKSDRNLESLKKEMDAVGVSFENSNALLENDYSITGLDVGQTTRDMIKWVYTANVNDVSPTVYLYDDKVDYYTNKFVIATVGSVQNVGEVDIVTNRTALMPLVKNIKKAEKLKIMMTGSIDDIASQNGVKVDTSNVAFSATALQGVGAEYGVIANAFSMDVAKESAPIVGETGVFKMIVTSRPVPEAISSDVTFTKKFSVNSLRSRLKAYLVKDMTKAADVEDMRSKIF